MISNLAAIQGLESADPQRYSLCLCPTSLSRPMPKPNPEGLDVELRGRLRKIRFVRALHCRRSPGVCRERVNHSAASPSKRAEAKFER